MGMKYTDEDLIKSLMKFVRGMPIEFNDITYIDLYGNKKPSELFHELLGSEGKDNDHVNYFFTELKKKSAKGKNFNRSIVGGGQWKGRDTSKEIVDKESKVIGLKKTFRFDEETSGSDNKNSVYWIMKEYCLDKCIVKVLRERGEIRHENSVVCSIMKKVSLCKNSQDIPTNIENIVSNCIDCVPNSSTDDKRWLYAAKIWLLQPLDEPFKSLKDEDLAFCDKPDPGYPQAYENKKLE
ncbi:uncharacterized protein LOC129871479 [Solanum dulcamara]|uniref:uncharacterized protein LOC129871479 n=1 Tax=Solanum dulcamara TaxID=45834 RepID=UPI00248646F0|nr:uncharacterized protein LOC129871479 [Solanum dulcamara]